MILYTIILNYIRSRTIEWLQRVGGVPISSFSEIPITHYPLKISWLGFPYCGGHSSLISAPADAGWSIKSSPIDPLPIKTAKPGGPTPIIGQLLRKVRSGEGDEN